FLMHIQSRAVGKDHVHDRPPELVTGGIPSCRESTLRALLPAGSWRQTLVPSGIRVTLPLQARGPRQYTTTRPATLPAFYRCSLARGSPWPFSCRLVPIRA